MRKSAVEVAKKRIEKLRHGGLDDDVVEALVQDLVNRGPAVYDPLYAVLAGNDPNDVERMKPLIEAVETPVLLDLALYLQYDDEGKTRLDTEGEKLCISALASRLPEELHLMLGHSKYEPEVVISIIFNHGPTIIPDLIEELAVLKYGVLVVTACHALRRFGAAARDAVPALMNVMINGTFTGPEIAALALSEISEQSEDFSFSLEDILDDDNIDLRNAAQVAMQMRESEDRMAKWEASESVAD